jgi:hypothetical protein
MILLLYHSNFLSYMTYPFSNQPCYDDNLKIEVQLANFDFRGNDVNICLQLFKESLELSREDTYLSRNSSILDRFDIMKRFI